MSDSASTQQQPASEEHKKQEPAPAQEPTKTEPAPESKAEPKKDDSNNKPAAAKEEPKKKDEPAAKKEAPAAKKDEPAAKKDESAKKDEPAKKDEQHKKDEPAASARSPSANNRIAQFPKTAEELAKMTPIERVKLGYQYLRELHQRDHPSAGFVSRTGRDPHRPFVPAGKTPQMIKREQIEEERRRSLSSKIHYDPNSRPVQSDFAQPLVTRGGPRGSSWSRDKSERRALAPSFETIASRLTPTTPGPGAYASPLSFLGA